MNAALAVTVVATLASLGQCFGTRDGARHGAEAEKRAGTEADKLAEVDNCLTQPLGPGDTVIVTATREYVQIITDLGPHASRAAMAGSVPAINISFAPAAAVADTVQKPRACYVFMSDTVQIPR